MMKHRLKGFYVFDTLHWLIIMDGFKYLGKCPTELYRCCRIIEEERQREIDLIRRALSD